MAVSGFRPTHMAGYGKMKMGHVGSPHCTLANILVFSSVLPQRFGAFFAYQRGRFLNWYQFGTWFGPFVKSGGFLVLNICDRIGVRVPDDLPCWLPLRIVAFAASSEAQACHKIKSAVCFFILPYLVSAIFILWPYFSIHLVSCFYFCQNESLINKVYHVRINKFNKSEFCLIFSVFFPEFNSGPNSFIHMTLRR